MADVDKEARYKELKEKYKELQAKEERTLAEEREAKKIWDEMYKLRNEEEAEKESEQKERKEERQEQKKEGAEERKGEQTEEKKAEKSRAASALAGAKQAFSGMASAAGKAKDVGGAAARGGMRVAAPVAGGLKDPGILLAIFGLFTFLADVTGISAVIFILETIFMFYTTILIFQWRGILPVTLFYIWYVPMGGFTDPNGLLYMLPTLLGIGIVVRGLVGLIRKEGFLNSSGSEFIGLLPIGFLFLDLGLVEFLTDYFGIALNPFLKNVLLFTPWWTLLGIFTSKSEHILATLLRIAGVLYVLSILTFGVLPDAYDSVLSRAPGPEKLLEAKKEFREQAGVQLNPFSKLMIQLSCSLSDAANAQECVQKETENREIRAICKGKGWNEGTPLYEECVKEERLKKKNPSLQVLGAIDPTIKKPTTAKLTLDVKNFPNIYDPNLPFPFEVRIENPRQQQIILGISCSFDGKEGLPDVRGSPSGGASDAPWEIRFSEDLTNSFLCYPLEKLEEGRYILQVNATLKNLTTYSRLQRAFIGDKSAKEKERLMRNEISKVISSPQSKAPADLAWIAFDLGHASNEAVIENKPHKPVIVKSKIENKGSGELVKVERYLIDLPGFTPKNPGREGFTCLEGSIRELKDAGREIPLPNCEIDFYPVELKLTEDWIAKEFYATLIYEYRITAKHDVKIEKELKIE